MIKKFFSLVLVCLFSNHLLGALPAHLDLTVSINLDNKKSVQIDGILSLEKSPRTTDLCLYLPYNSQSLPLRLGHRNRLKQILGNKSISYPLYEKGETQVLKTKGLEFSELSAKKIRVKSTGETKIFFKSRVPLPMGSKYEEIFIESFYPKIIESCLDSKDEKVLQYSSLKVDIRTPKNWDLVAAEGRLSNNKTESLSTFFFKGTEASFILFRNKSKFSYTDKDLKVDIYYSSKNFVKDYIETIKSSLTQFRSWFGPLPYKKMIIFETGDLVHSNIPGVVPINRPRQNIAVSLQKKFLNWMHWSLASLIGSQWYGVLIRSKHPYGEWLTDGVLDFVLGEIFVDLPVRGNIFNNYDNSFSLLSFRYSQFQELIAAFMVRRFPGAKLLRKNGHLVPSEKKAPFFIKQTYALKSLLGYLGRVKMQKLLLLFTKKHLNKNIDADGFVDFLMTTDILSKEKKIRVKEIIQNWWETDSWPDFETISFFSKPIDERRWLASLKFQQNSRIDLPTNILFSSDSGESAFFFCQFSAHRQGYKGRCHYGF